MFNYKYEIIFDFVNNATVEFFFLIINCIGNHRDANAATTITTIRVTRFLPRCDSADMRPPTPLCHNRDSILTYKPLIKINGNRYELEKNAI